MRSKLGSNGSWAGRCEAKKWTAPALALKAFGGLRLAETVDEREREKETGPEAGPYEMRRKNVTFRVDANERARLDDQAGRLDITLSELIRQKLGLS